MTAIMTDAELLVFAVVIVIAWELGKALADRVMSKRRGS